MTRLITSILPERLADVQDAAECAWAGRSDAVEIRIDRYTEDLADLAAYLRRNRERCWIVTCRAAAEGGMAGATAERRLTDLKRATKGTCAFVDFEYADWLRSDKVRARLLAHLGKADNGGVRLILSSHGPDVDRRVLIGAVRNMLAIPECSCAKVAYHADHIDKTFAALDAVLEGGRRVTAVAMGEAGLWTRVLARKLGAFGSYCALEADRATAPGQLTLDEMIDLYRWHDIGSATRVFGVIGEPVAHSMGPLLFNRWFAAGGVDAVYLPLRVGARDDGLRRFLDGCLERPWLDLGGLSVTVPHKVAALEWVREGAEPQASRMGAVNTLAFAGGNATGHNTDKYAAVASLYDALACDRLDLAGMTVDILGCGGAARALMHGLNEFGCAMTVYARDHEKARAVAEAYKAAVRSWEDRAERTGEILVNATSVGMWPGGDESPMPPDSLRGCRMVYDLIYNPLETRLLRDARRTGCQTLGGLDMFVRQAALQFELWTGKSPDREYGRSVVEQRIRKESAASA